MRAPRVILLLALLCASVGRVRAEGDGKIYGTVRGVDGQPIENAKLVLSDPTTGIRIEFSSDRQGKYYRRGLPPYVFQLVVTKEGFQEFRGENIKIPAGGEKSVDVTMVPRVVEPVETPAEAAYRTGYQAIQAGDLEAAKREMERVIADRPDDFRAHYLLGSVYLRQNLLDQAQLRFEQVILLKPDFADAYFDLGTVATRQQDMTKALENFRRAAELQPDEPEAHYNVGVILLNEGNPTEATVALRRALEIKPDHPNAHKSLGYALVQENQLAESIAHLEKYLELQPEASDRAEIEAILAEVKKSAGSTSP
jgi:tetratricopeptide (TPR) repeat protein